MKVAIQTRTVSKDYDWYSSDNSFKIYAQEQWLNWHNDIYDGIWFGLTSQNNQTCLLIGNIPTKRRDKSNRNIVDYIVLQSETPEERTQLALLTSDLLKNRQDVNDVDSPFAKWADEICFPMAEKDASDATPYTPFQTLETSFPAEPGTPIERFEYPLSSMEEREQVANALGSLLEKQEDFLLGFIQYPVKKLLAKVGDNLSCDMKIAVFSARTDSKKELPGTEDPFVKKNPMNSKNPWNQNGGDGTTSSNVLKALFNPLSIMIGVLALMIIISGLLWIQNSQKATQIQNLNDQISSLEEALEKTSNELQAKKAEIEELKKQINSSKE